MKIQYIKLNLFSNSYTVTFLNGNNYQNILQSINSHFIMMTNTDKSHYSYLSIELIKAEICLQFNQIYIQS
uniref:Uncharacterized protein n=1 Tax=Porphyridium sordidum TaxID=28024 RepID=A0A1C9CDW2_PORSO|nr:hypothetical protein Psor_059 [Porphyridium sordidum]AOM66534.1 hypothetical protein Psor_059 [Porphyridium sordidum]